MSAEYNNLCVCEQACMPTIPHSSSGHILCCFVLLRILSFFCSMWCLFCVIVRCGMVWCTSTLAYAYLWFYLWFEWKLWGTSIGWFSARAVLQLVLDAMYKMTSNTHTYRRRKKNKTLPALSAPHYYFSVESKASSIKKKKSAHTNENSQVHHRSRALVLVLPLSLLGTIILSSFFLRCFFFLFIRSFDEFLLLDACTRSITSWAEFMYQILVY